VWNLRKEINVRESGMDNTEQTRESKNKIGKTDQNKTNHNTAHTTNHTELRR
jgi:hypothetical protein